MLSCREINLSGLIAFGLSAENNAATRLNVSPVLDGHSSEDRVSKTAISNVSRVFNHIFQSVRQRAHSVKYVTVSERLYERRRGWSVVKGRSDIYTRPLPLVHSVGCYMVSWWNTETPNIHTLRSLSLSLLSCASFLSTFHFISLSFSAPVLSVFCLSFFPLPFLLYIIPFRPLASSSLSPFFFAAFPSSLPFCVWSIAVSSTAGRG